MNGNEMLKGKTLNIITLVLPALLTLGVFYSMVYFYLIPGQYESLVAQKRLIIKEVIYLGWQVADKHYRHARQGKISMARAKNLAMREIDALRWEVDKKNYYYIINSRGKMLVHPFHPELVNTTVLDLQDDRGYFIIKGAISAAQNKKREGYIEYVWDRPTMPGAVLHKLTFVKAFVPWDWIICSGVYYDDILAEHHQAKRNMNRVFLVTIAVIMLMLGLMIYRVFTGEKKQETTKSKLAASEEKFRDIFNNTYQLIGLLDIEGRLVEVNQTALDLIGVGADKYINRYFWETEWWSYSPEIQENLKSVIEECRKDHRTIRFDVIHFDYHGRPVSIDFSLKPLLDKEENLRGFIAEGRDVTEQRRMEEQMRHAQKMESIGKLAGGVAHDFNNMLGGIMGAAEMLKRYVSGAKPARYLDMILLSAENAAGLTQKLLAFSRKERITLNPVNLHDTIRSTIAILERTIDKKIDIATDFSAEHFTISGDESILQNALLNLGINAANAMPSGGTITFNTVNVFLEEMYCRESPFELKSGDYLEIEIEDTGRGIPVEDLDRIFDPFFTTMQQGKGTGLGLAAVYGTIQQHEGAITVYSEVNVGTVFHLFFPLSDDTAHPAVKDEAELIGGTGRILVIDDEQVIRATAEAILEDLGYEVVLAENGQEGLSIFENSYRDIDLVIIDMVMPEMNGSECFFEMIKIDPGARVILASGFSRNESLIEMQKKGLRAAIRKPYRAAELSRIVASVLQEEP